MTRLYSVRILNKSTLFISERQKRQLVAAPNIARKLHTKGFTLLEMMIALATGLFLLIGVFETFEAARQSYRYIQGLALIQENGQLASYILTREVSQAGYVGCRKIDGYFSVQSHIGARINANELIHGYNHQNLPSSEKSIARQMISDSAVIAVQGMNADTASLVKSLNNGSSLSINEGSTFTKGDDVLIADCMHADVVSLVSAGSQVIKTNVNVHDYEAGAQVGKWRNEWFYIGPTGRMNTAHLVVTALYMHQPNGRDEELIDNVANMHVQYGYITKSGNLKFVSASQVTDWAEIKAARVILLLSSGEPVLSRKQTVKFDGYDWQPPDRQLYKQWEVIVPLLNR